MTRNPILGCIADDLTGATDVANNLVRAGMQVVLRVGVPEEEASCDADAVVVALKSRTIPAQEAIVQSLAACRWLRRRGVRQIYFKICSTFDSTPIGNIGPVLKALMREVGTSFSWVVPAFPENGRTVYQGHLFVGEVLLSESGMRDHPLTPMRDPNLVRFLQLQMGGGGGLRTGLVDERAVGTSAEAIRARVEKLRAEGVSVAIVDTISNADLGRIATALSDEPLVTASSGLGSALPASWGFNPDDRSDRLSTPQGRKAIVSGSCSPAANAQLADFLERGGPGYLLDVGKLSADGGAGFESIWAWAEESWAREPDRAVLVYSTAPAESVKAVHGQYGVERSGEMVEHALATVARGLVERGAAQLLVAGGETSGMCVNALGIKEMRIGPQIDPGVPWCSASSPARKGAIHIALKSGNFGSRNFFSKAFSILDETE